MSLCLTQQFKKYMQSFIIKQLFHMTYFCCIFAEIFLNNIHFKILQAVAALQQTKRYSTNNYKNSVYAYSCGKVPKTLAIINK